MTSASRFLLGAFFLTGCASAPFRDDRVGCLRDFECADPVTHGFSETELSKFVREAERRGTDVLLVARGKTIIVHRDFRKSSERYPLHSLTKSILAFLTVQLDENHVLKTEDHLGPSYPEWTDHGDKQEIKIHHLLAHTSGLTDDPELYRQDDWLQWLLKRELTTSPGETFSYSNGGAVLLGDVLRRRSGRSVDELMKARIWGPLDAKPVHWQRDRSGTLITSGGLVMWPDDLLRFGVMVRDAGRWKGEVLLLPQNVARLLQPSRAESQTYGLLWRMYAPDARLIGGNGFGGQYLTIDRRFDVVAVRLRKIDPKERDKEDLYRKWTEFPDEVRALFAD